jgi:hypothetical protein
VQVADPQVDCWAATATQRKRLFVLLPNNDDNAKTTRVQLNPEKLALGQQAKIRKAELPGQTGSKRGESARCDDWQVSILVLGLAVVTLELEQRKRT